MLILYFSGTGNTKYIAERFGKNINAACHSIEENIDFSAIMKKHKRICICYPVYGSRVPPIFKTFVKRHGKSFKSKKVIILATQWGFSGDGARAFTYFFPKNYFDVIYAEHIYMPNNICNFVLFPVKNGSEIKRVLQKADVKIDKICNDLLNGKSIRRGFNVFSKILGSIQGKYTDRAFKSKKWSVVVDNDCVGCGLCVKVCPVENLELKNKKVEHKGNCTVCYRCVNKCPKMAITTFIHKKPNKQYHGAILS